MTTFFLGVRYLYGIGTGVKKWSKWKKELKNFKGLNMESFKTYAEPLYLPWNLRKSHFTVFNNTLIPRSSYQYFYSFRTDTETPVYYLLFTINFGLVYLERMTLGFKLILSFEALPCSFLRCWLKENFRLKTLRQTLQEKFAFFFFIPELTLLI